jgi:hypothetical protein
MLGSISNDSPAIAHQVREGLTVAGVSTASPAPLSAFAATAVVRLPQLPSSSVLLADFARQQDNAIAPTRKDLLDSIKLAARAGTINSAQTRWLANNTERPAHLYRACQTLLADAYSPQTELLNFTGVSLISQWPLAQISKFVASWMRQDASLVDLSLIRLLAEAKNCVTSPKGTVPYDPTQLATALNSFVSAIADKLNQFNDEAHRNEFNPLSPSVFVPSIGREGVLAMEACDVIGVQLPHAASEGQPEYWNLIKLCLHLISDYLQPMALPNDVDDMMMMRFEDDENDVFVVDAYLKDKGLEWNEKNVEIALGECADEIFSAGGYEDIEMFKEQMDDAKRIISEWQVESNSIAALSKQLQALPQAQSDLEQAITDLATDLHRILTSEISGEQWHKLDEELPFPFMHTIVFRDTDEPVKEQAQMFFEHVMQGGCEEDGYNRFDWTVKPAVLMEASKRLTFATQILIKIVGLDDLS